LPRLDDFLTLLPPLWELAMALFDRPPPDRAACREPPPPPDRAASRLPPPPPDRAAVRWPPPCPTALFLALLRLAEPRTLCFFTSRAGFGAAIALLGFAAATCVPGRLAAGLAASALARVGLRVAAAAASGRRWRAGWAAVAGVRAASPGASACRFTDAGAIPAAFALPLPSAETC
jgi:hypothetical protein